MLLGSGHFLVGVLVFANIDNHSHSPTWGWVNTHNLWDRRMDILFANYLLVAQSAKPGSHSPAQVTIAHWFQVAGPATPEELAEALWETHTHFAALQDSRSNFHIDLRVCVCRFLSFRCPSICLHFYTIFLYICMCQQCALYV
jgi:hypothetical protein